MLTQPDAAFDLPAYLARIGFAGAPAPDAATLAEICRLHPMAIPFENLSPLTGAPVSLDIADLQAKMIGARRGGYCFEQNMLLAHALAAIGFPVSGLGARVLWERPEGTVGGQTHMALRVQAEGRDLIADAGFGGCTLTAPLLLEAGTEQPTPHGAFRFSPEGEDLTLSAQIGGAWKPVFQLGLQQRFRPDYEIANYYVSTHPGSRFTNALIVSAPFEGGRRVLFNRRLTEYRAGDAGEHRELDSPEALEAVLEDIFGLEIPDRAALRRAVERLPQTPAAA
jgi:N-hydroxyarylamine O-acetyltransferase